MLDGCGVKYLYAEKQQNQTHGYICFPSLSSFNTASDSFFPLTIDLPRGPKAIPLRRVTARDGMAPPLAISLPPRAQQPPIPLGSSTEALKSVHDAVTPWHTISYTKQLERKASAIHFALVRISRRLAESVGADMPRPSRGSKRARVDHSSAAADEDEDDAGGGDGDESGGGDETTATTTTTIQQPQQPPVLRDSAILPHELEWLRTRTTTLNGAACVRANVQRSPEETGYRNKCQWSAGLGADGLPLFGFFLGSFTSGHHTIAAAESYAHVPEALMVLQKAGTRFLRTSKLAPYDECGHTGVWRSLTVRWAATPKRALIELLASPPPITVTTDTTTAATDTSSSASSSSSLSIYTNEVEVFADALMALTFEGQALVSSVSVQEYSGLSSPDVNAPRRLLRGSAYLVDTYPSLGLSFRVSAGAFLQVNTRAAERLYTIVRALAVDGVSGARVLLGNDLPGRGGITSAATWSSSSVIPAPLPTLRPALTILDICCGGGLIGLACAPFVGRVLGVDECGAAIDDARANAELNHIDANQSVFECGRAEHLIDDFLTKRMKDGTSAVAIVDPPRAGLHPSVIGALRLARGVKRIVYVSCNPEVSFVKDAVLLCMPVKIGARGAARGNPFRPVCAIPLDLFPQTPGIELITLFERD